MIHSFAVVLIFMFSRINNYQGNKAHAIFRLVASQVMCCTMQRVALLDRYITLRSYSEAATFRGRNSPIPPRPQ